MTQQLITQTLELMATHRYGCHNRPPYPPAYSNGALDTDLRKAGLSIHTEPARAPGQGLCGVCVA